MLIKTNKLKKNKMKIKENLNHFEYSHGRFFFFSISGSVNLIKK